MNRRTFLKTTGIISLLGITNISLGQKEQQWIETSQIRPQVGQRCVTCVVGGYNDIWVGIIERYRGKTFVSINIECNYNISKNKNNITFATYCKDRDRKLDKFIRKQWIGGEINERNRYKKMPGSGFHMANGHGVKTYWVPLDDDYNIPKELPKN